MGVSAVRLGIKGSRRYRTKMVNERIFDRIRNNNSYYYSEEYTAFFSNYK
jgi:hypothetical protein